MRGSQSLPVQTSLAATALKEEKIIYPSQKLFADEPMPIDTAPATSKELVNLASGKLYQECEHQERLRQKQVF